jgi:long-subunit fatty acid transport protein
MKLSMSHIVVVLAVLLAGQQQANAINGTNLIGATAGSRAMGGTGVAHFTTPFDTLAKNSALLAMDGSEVGQLTLYLGGLYAQADISASVTRTGPGALATGVIESDGDPFYGVSLGATYRLNEDLSFGLGLLPYSIGGVDYKGQDAFFEVKSEFLGAKVVPSVSYEVVDGWSLGAAPVLQLNAAAVNSDLPGWTTDGTQSTTPLHYTTAFGFQVGVAGQILDSLVVGAIYSSEAHFVNPEAVEGDILGPDAGPATAEFDDLPFDQPAEIAVGVAYKPLSDLTLTLDARSIFWHLADAYYEFLWERQEVYAIGVEYAMKSVRVRTGYNYGKSPIPNTSGANGFDVLDVAGHSVYRHSRDFLNAVAFPSITEHHITGGLGCDLGENLSLDLGVVYFLENTVTLAGKGVPGGSEDTEYSNSSTAGAWEADFGINLRL